MTTDAQSALRRCIELFSNTSRFFIIIENKYKLLKPIISRFCDIYVPLPTIKNKQINLHQYNINQVFKNDENRNINNWMKREIGNINQDKENPGKAGKTGKVGKTGKAGKAEKTVKELIELTEKIYNHGLSALDVMEYFQNNTELSDNLKFKFLLYFNKIKREYRNEKLLIINILYYIFLRCDFDLENIINIY